MNPSFLLLECREAASDAGKTPYKPMDGALSGGIQVIGLQKKSGETQFNMYYQPLFSNLFRNILLY